MAAQPQMEAFKATVLPAGGCTQPGQARVALRTARPGGSVLYVADRNALHKVELQYPDAPKRYIPSDAAAFPEVATASLSGPIDGHRYRKGREIHEVVVQCGALAEGLVECGDGGPEEFRLGSVDSGGCGRVSRMCGDDVAASWTVLPPDTDGPLDAIGGGGAAMLLNPHHEGGSVVTSKARRTVTLYDEDRVVSTINTLHSPHAAAYIIPTSDNPLIAVAEGQQVSVWDVARASAPVTRQLVSAATLRAVVADSKGAVLAGGDERTVYSLNPRTWRVEGAWSGALKYGIGTIIPSVTRSETVFAAAYSDAELAGGTCAKVTAKVSRMNSKARCQGDARWVGLTRAATADDVFALTAAGSLYVFRNLFANDDAAAQGDPSAVAATILT